MTQSRCSCCALGSISTVPLPIADGILPWKQCTNNQNYDYNCSYGELMPLFSAVLARGKRQVFRQCEYIKRRCKWELKLLCRAAASHFFEADHCSTFLRALGSLSLLGPGSSNSLPWLSSVLAQNCSVAELLATAFSAGTFPVGAIAGHFPFQS